MEQLQFFENVKRKVIVAILGDDELGDQLVLKGGNLLQFAYEISYRASKDVDISISGDFENTAVIGSKVENCLTNAFGAEELVLLDFKFTKRPSKISADLEDFWGGYACEFKLIDAAKHAAFSQEPDRLSRSALRIVETGSPTFKIDFSRYEYCEDSDEFVIDGYTVRGYSPRMFVAEKIRALCQQMPAYSHIVHRTRATSSRARDFVDIHLIVTHYGVDFTLPEFHEIVRKTFQQKKVPLTLIGQLKDYREAHEVSFATVRSSVNPTYKLQEFDFYFDWLCEKCRLLESLWNV